MKSEEPNPGEAGTGAQFLEEAQTRWRHAALRADGQGVGAAGSGSLPLSAEPVLSPAMYTWGDMIMIVISSH